MSVANIIFFHVCHPNWKSGKTRHYGIRQHKVLRQLLSSYDLFNIGKPNFAFSFRLANPPPLSRPNQPSCGACDWCSILSFSFCWKRINIFQKYIKSLQTHTNMQYGSPLCIVNDNYNYTKDTTLSYHAARFYATEL